jgi:AcrR family transcriptional regulator
MGNNDVTSQQSVGTEPPTAKGRDTRNRLLEAGRTLFGERGYSNVRVVDITSAARLSQGAFYRYFSDRRELMLELLRELTSEAFDFVRTPWHSDSPMTSVLESTKRYFAFYDKNRALFAILMELEQGDPDVGEIGAKSRQQFRDRIARSIKRGISDGVLRPDLDVHLAAEMLESMTEYYAFQRFVLRRSHTAASVDDAAGTLARIWMDGVKATDS